MSSDDVGYLPAIAIATLFIFYVVWGAMHDIAHARETNLALEYVALALTVPAFAWLYKKAVPRMGPKARLAWLIGTSLLITLYSLAALNAILSPKYPKDPMLGWMFLAAGVPAFALIGYRLVRKALLLRNDASCRDLNKNSAL